MAVVAIIGIISYVAVGNYASYSQRAKISEAMQYAKNMQSAYAQYLIQTGQTPTSLQDLNLTSITTPIISSTAYTNGANAFTVNINVASLDLAAAKAGCSLGYYFIPQVNGDILTWNCQIISQHLNPACETLIRQASPAECTFNY
jgi:type II secretory pathway pseudopilin PulG